MSVYSSRRKKILELAGNRKILVNSPVNLFYLTDFFGSGIGIIYKDKTLIITNKMEQSRAEKFALESEVISLENWQEYRKVIPRYLDNECITDNLVGLEGLKSIKQDKTIFIRARRRKDSEEIKRITHASKIIDSIFSLLEKEIRPGRTEFEIASYAMKEAIENGATTNGFENSLSPIIIACGEDSAYPHSDLSSRKVKQNDVVLCDISLRFKGYNSDATRTFVVGRADDEFKKNYQIIMHAQQEGVELCVANKRCSEISVKTKKAMKGLDKFLNHGIGHGVGIEIHEAPSISDKSIDTLDKNDVVTIEPGIYITGRYGIRIEDTILVGNEPKVLHSFSKDLIEI